MMNPRTNVSPRSSFLTRTGIFMLTAMLICGASEVAYAAGAGYFSLFGDVSETPDTSCGAGQSRFNFVTREYDSETPVSVANITIKTIGGANPQTVSGDSNFWLTNTICVEVATQAIEVRADDGEPPVAYQSFFGSYTIKNPLNWTGKRITSHIHLRRLTDGPSVSHGFSPEDKWYQTQPSFDVVVDSIPVPPIHKTSSLGVHGVRLYTATPATFWAYTTQTGGEGTYTITLPNGALTEGRLSWGFYVGLDGGSPDPISGWSGLRQFGLDATPPAPVTASRSVNTVSETSTFTVTGRATDPLSGMSKIEIYFGDTVATLTLIKTCEFVAGETQGPTSEQSCTSSTIGPFPYGSTHVHEVRAFDKAGNESTNTSSFTVACTKDNWTAGGNPNQFQGCFYKDWTGAKQGDAPAGPLLSAPAPLVTVALDYDWGLTPPPLEVFDPTGTNDYFSTQWVGTFTFAPGSYRFYANAPQAYQYLYMWNPSTKNWEQKYWSYGNQEFIRYFSTETTITFAWTVIHSKTASNKRVTFGWDQNILCNEQAFGINRFFGCAYNGTNLNYAQNVLRATTAPGPQLSDPVPTTAVAMNNRWGYGSPDALVNNDYFYTRHKATFNMPKAATYRFVLGFDTGANVYFGTGFDLNGNLMNSELVSENWYNQSDSLESNPGGVALRNDNGLSMYMLGGGTDTAYQYSLGTAWSAASANTAEYAAKAVAMEDTNPTGFFFKPDGTMMYMVGTGSTTKKVSQYLLSPPWDITTATLVGTANIYQETSPTGVFIGNGGLTMYVVGTTYDTVHKYTLSSAWNITSAVYANSFKSIGSQESSPQDLFFSADGRKMYIIGTVYDQVREYSLKTAWMFDALPANDPLAASFNVGTQETSPTGMYFDPTGTKLYVVGTNNDTVYQYTLTTAWSIASASYDSSSLPVGGSGLDMFLKLLPAGPLSVEIRHYENYNNAQLSFAWSEKGGPIIYCDPALTGNNQFIGCVYNGTSFINRVSVPQDDVPLIIGPDTTDPLAPPLVKEGVTAYSYNWGDSSPAPAKVGVDSWSMELNGIFKFSQGTFDFTAHIACCNSFMYVYFNDVEVAYLTSGTNTFSYDFTNPLGENVAIKIRYANVSGAAQVGFSWVRAASGINLTLLSPLSSYSMFPGKEGPVAHWVSVWATSTSGVGGVRFQDGNALNGPGANVAFPQMDVVGIRLRHEPNKGGASYNSALVPFQFTGPGGNNTYTWNLGYFWDSLTTTFSPISGVTGLNMGPSTWNLQWYPQLPADTMYVDLLDFSAKGFVVRIDSESGFAGTVSVDIPNPPVGITKTGVWPKTCIILPYDYCTVEGLSVRATDVGTPSDIYKTYTIPIVASTGALSTQTVGTVITRGYDISVSPSTIPQFPPGSSLTYTVTPTSRNSYNGNVTVEYTIDPPTSTIVMTPASIAMAPSSDDGTVVSRVKKVLENLALAVNWWSTNSASVTVNTTAATPEQEYTITMTARAQSPEGPLERVIERKFIITSTPSIEAVPTDPDLTGQTLSWTGTAVAGNTYIFSAYAKNLSSTIPAGAMTARFCIDNPNCLTDTSGSLGNVAVPGLSSLGAYEVTSSWIATAGNHTVYFCVDVGAANGVVPETNETNNCIQSASFTVTNLSVAFTVSAPSVASPVDTGISKDTSVTIPYNSFLSFRYDSVDAVSCDYSDTTGGVVTPIWSGGPTSSFWPPPPAGPYTGSFTRQVVCNDVNGNSSRPANLIVTVLPPPLILSLSANPPAGLDPLTTTLSAPVGGSATGRIDYYFWWNCSSASTDAALLNQNGGGGCGRLPNPANGSCSLNNRGALCSQMSIADPWSVPQSVTSPANSPYQNPGIYTAKVIVNRGGYAAQATTTVDVSTIPPQLQVFPLTLDFNDVVVNESRDLNLRVTNVGRGVLTGSLAIPAGPFTCSPANVGGATACASLGAGLLANQSLNFLIRFMPPALGPFQDNIAVTSNGGNATVGMIGRGVDALVSAGLNFGNVIVNRTKDLTFTLTNNSTVVDIGSGTLNFGGQFTCVSSSIGGAGVCSYNLPSGATNTFVIRFSPIAITSYTENATLSNAPGYSFPFIGNGITGTIKFQDQ